MVWYGMVPGSFLICFGGPRVYWLVFLVDFGDSTFVGSDQGTASSSTRGITAGGYLSPSHTNIIQFVTIMTLGDFLDFGDLYNSGYQPGGVSNATRAVFCPSYTPSTTNHIEFITMASTGNAMDFGDSATSAPKRQFPGREVSAVSCVPCASLASSFSGIDKGQGQVFCAERRDVARCGHFM